MKKFSTLVTLLLILISARAQVNGYAKVTGIVGPVLTVSNVNETYGSFNIGDKVIIMQMQDDVIGSNTAQNSSFGNLATIANAGRFEVATVLLVARVAGIVNVVTLTSPLNNVYSLNSNSSLQMISFPTLGNPNYTTTSNITALPWDGNIGGVVAFHTPGRLTLNHNISADNAGFRGGARDPNDGTHSNCNNTTFYSASSVLYGNKGEGIYKVTNANYYGANGRMINGGGGGNGHNGGGGGGSNYTAGGSGADGYGCSIISGGYGGLSLGALVSGNRYFLGGGGGSGEANNGGNNKGGNGGGIVLIKANEIATAGSAARRISANGENGGSVNNDGAGGGGAGGTLFMEVNQWNVIAAAPLTLSSNAGDGGDVNDGARHGGGAGGGQGAVMFSSAVPSTNTTTSTANGSGGRSWTGGTRAPSGTGSANGGVLTTTFIVLPVKLISFTASTHQDKTSLQWISENERTFSHFEVQFSENGSNFYGIGRVNGRGNAGSREVYDFVSTVKFDQTQYYRLKMVDQDGKATYSKIIAVRNGAHTAASMTVYPNPAKTNPVLNIKSVETGEASVAILNMQGSVLRTENIKVKSGDNPIVLQQVNDLASAVYNVRVVMNGKIYFTRLIVQK